MKVLAIDTAGWIPSVALWEDGQEIAFGKREQERNQAALLPELVTEVLGNHKIDQILVNVGPGSFTGIRLGLAFAKGLAIGWNLPLKGLDGFTVSYLGLEAHSDVLVLIEARRQDVYAQWFQEGIPQLATSLTRGDIEKLLSSINPPYLAGSGVCSLLEGLSFNEVVSPFKGAQSLAHAYFKAPHLFGDPTPFYVREADVTYPSNSCLSHH